jgi:hypothetical protein
LDDLARDEERGKVALTRPSARVISSTKWEVNITRKYSVASSTMVAKIPVNSSPPIFDLLAKKRINKNARESGVYNVEVVSPILPRSKIAPTYHRRERCLYTLSLAFCAG